MTDWTRQARWARDREISYRSAYSSAEILRDADAMELLEPLIEAAAEDAELCEKRAACKEKR